MSATFLSLLCAEPRAAPSAAKNKQSTRGPMAQHAVPKGGCVPEPQEIPPAPPAHPCSAHTPSKARRDESEIIPFIAQEIKSVDSHN